MPHMDSLTTDTRAYRNGEFLSAGMHDATEFRIKVICDRGETKWLTVSHEEAYAIADILTRTAGPTVSTL